MSAHLSSRGLIGLKGPDWRSFLHGLITQDVLGAEPGLLSYGAILTPQGRYLQDFFFWGDEMEGTLDVPLAHREALIARLKLYRLRAKVEISPKEGRVLAAWGGPIPPGDASWRPDPRAPGLGWRCVSQEAAANAEETHHQDHCLTLGVADLSQAAVETDYPLELGLDLLNAVDFHKGCFIGQETTSRMHRRGVVKNRLAPVVFEGEPPPFGAEVACGERRAGELRNGRNGRAFALLRLDRLDRGPLTVLGRPLTVDAPTWLAPVLAPPDDDGASETRP